MCKVLAIAGVKKGQQEMVRKLAVAAVAEFCSSDGDGFGYAAMTRDGLMFGEKWLDREEAFRIHKQTSSPRSLELLMNRVSDVVKIPDYNDGVTYGTFGPKVTKEMWNDTASFMMHCRKKTIGDKTITNTHPFYMPETKDNEALALIHNGSITNHEKLVKMFSSCDSEVIMHEYLKETVMYVPENIKNVAKALIGEYTAIVLSKYFMDSDKAQIYMDIFKSNKDLHVGYVRELDNLVYCTAGKFSFEKLCKDAGLTIDHILEIEDGKLLRLDGMTGEMLLADVVKFEKSAGGRSFGYSYNQNYNYNRDPYVPAVTPPATLPGAIVLGPRKAGSAVDALKREFEKNHKESFSSQFMTVEPLSAADHKLIAEFEKQGDRKLRALALVHKGIFNQNRS